MDLKKGEAELITGRLVFRFLLFLFCEFMEVEMENIKELGLVVLVIAAVIGIVFVLFPYLKKRGVDVSKTMSAIGSGIDTVDKAVDTISTIAPDLPFLVTLNSIITICQKGYEYAEKLCAAGEIGKGPEKKAAATENVYEALRVLGIEITPEVEKIVDGSLEITVSASHAALPSELEN